MSRLWGAAVVVLSIGFAPLAQTGESPKSNVLAARAAQAVQIFPEGSRPVTICAPLASVEVILKSASAQSGVKLAADPSVAQDRLIVFAKTKPLPVLMDRLATLHGWIWQVSASNSEKVYTLSKPESVAAAERAQQKAYVDGRDKLANARTKMMRSLLDRAAGLAGKTDEEKLNASRGDTSIASALNGPSDALFGMIAGMPSEQRDALAESAWQPTGPISASDQSHIARSIQFSAPLSSLSSSHQKNLLGAAGTAGNSDGSAYAGIVASEGSVSLAVVEGGDIAWISGGLQLPSTPEMYATQKSEDEARLQGKEVRYTDWSEPILRQQLEDKYQVELFPNPNDFRVALSKDHQALKFSSKDILRRRRLESYLETIHNQTGLTIVADGLMASSRLRHGWTLSGASDWSLQSAFPEISRTFKVEVASDHGSLFVRARRYAVARLFEIPQQTLKAMETEKRESGVNLERFVSWQNQLSPEQIEMLGLLPEDECTLQTTARTLKRYAPVIRLWGTCSARERAQCEGEGLKIDQLDSSRRKDFWRSVCLAVPSAEPLASKSDIRLKRFDASSVFTFSDSYANSICCELTILHQLPQVVSTSR